MGNAPSVNEFRRIISSVTDGTRPSATYGASHTPGTNSYGTYTEMLSAAKWTSGDGDAFGILLNINTVGISTESHTALATIGIDPAGGTSYVDTINDLLIGPSSQLSGVACNGGCWYYFPLKIREGSTIAYKVSRSNGTATVYGFCYLYCKPTHPEIIKAGSFVRTFGAAGPSTFGTAVTDGGASEGGWTQLGSALAEPLWYWEWGAGCQDTNMTANAGWHDIGIGDASNKKIAVRDGLVISGTGEVFMKPPWQGRNCQAAPGDLVYARTQWGPNAADTNFAMAAYGVGG